MRRIIREGKNWQEMNWSLFTQQMWTLLRVLPPLSSLRCHRQRVSPASAQASDVIFGAALAAALPCHTQGKVPLLLAGWWSRRLLRRFQLRRPPLLPEKSHKVSQRGEGAERGGDFWELCAGRPTLHVVLRRGVTGGTPLKRVWRKRIKHYTRMLDNHRFLDFQHRNYVNYPLNLYIYISSPQSTWADRGAEIQGSVNPWKLLLG